MIDDFREFEENAVIETDLCLIGAGAAGITIANEYLSTNTDVCLIESGGFDFDFAEQNLYEFENVGLSRSPSWLTRLRFFGGTTNHWDGRCAPLNEIDFEERSWVPYSGWPFKLSELIPYYERANSVCDLGEYIYDNRILGIFDIPDPNLNPEKLLTQIWKYSLPTRFGQKYKESLKGANNIRVLLHANATNIQTNAGATYAEFVDIATLEGKKGRVKAKKFILCCGGIENARLLLLSNKVEPHGIANRDDNVGRYFMEHLRSKNTLVHFGDPFSMKRIFNSYQYEKGRYELGLRTSKAVQEDRKILNGGAMTYFEGNSNSATHSLSRLKESIKAGQIPEEFADDTMNVIADFDEILINLRRRYLRPNSNALINNISVLVVETEQAPNPNSRISLSEKRDALGLRKSKIDWRLSELDKLTTINMTKLLSAELARLYDSRFRLQDWMEDDRDNWSNNFKDLAHHMGTTRMANNPKHGVVDKDCKVHGLENLYIAGSSVFPTSGHVNPTMTIVALALRLASHIKATI